MLPLLKKRKWKIKRLFQKNVSFYYCKENEKRDRKTSCGFDKDKKEIKEELIYIIKKN